MKENGIVSEELLKEMLEGLKGHKELAVCITELVDPQMGTVSGFQDIIDSINRAGGPETDGFDPL